jgi:hypothetical protein
MSLQEQLLTQGLRPGVELELMLVEDRIKAMAAFHKDTIGVHQAAQDMALLVHDQGETLDNIEWTIERSATNTHTAVRQLAQAERKANWWTSLKTTAVASAATVATVALIILL